MHNAGATHLMVPGRPASDAMLQCALEVPVVRIVREFCDEAIVEDNEYRDCRLAWTTTTGLFSGTPCGDHVRTADHHAEVDVLYVDGFEVRPPRPHVWRHRFDDVLDFENTTGKDAGCRAYVPPAGTTVWAVGYPAAPDDPDDPDLDARPKVAFEGVVMDDGGFHPDIIHIEMKGLAGPGMSGGPVVADVDGTLVTFATIVGGDQYDIPPDPWQGIFRRRAMSLLRARLCLPGEFEGGLPDTLMPRNSAVSRS